MNLDNLKTVTICIFVMMFLQMTTSCDDRDKHSESFEIIDLMSEKEPKKAIVMLDSIDYNSLSEKERHHYDLLQIKANDKAYVIHTSDSLILDVIDYYSGHKEDEMYAQALYYGGRVYSDLGDYPTALKYFHDALDAIPEKSENLGFKANVLSQTCRLLVSLRLYSEALPYIKEAIDIRKNMNDTLGFIHETQLLAGLFLRAERYGDAESYYQESYKLCQSKYPELAAKALMYIAECKFNSEGSDSAIPLLRNLPDKVSPVVRNRALASAACMYYDAGFPDTAYMYAKYLIESPRQVQKDIGYHVLLSPAIAKHLPLDSLLSYVEKYRTMLESFYNDNENKMALIQQSSYNYGLHEHEKKKAEASRAEWQIAVIITIVIIAVLTMMLMVMKIRSQKRILKLHRALELISYLKSQLDAVKNVKLEMECHEDKNVERHSNLTVPEIVKYNIQSSLRIKLRNELRELNEQVGKIQVSDGIIESSSYIQLVTAINDGIALKDNDPLWKNLEDTILKCSPSFKTRLNLLTRGRMSTEDLQMALLIKCGIRPVHISRLMARSNGAIVSRRLSIGYKIFDMKVEIKVVDGIIRLL